jgi:hypothetical protein
MRRTDIVTGAELYLAAGEQWKVVPPKRATVVDPGPYRIHRATQGPFTFVSHTRDDAGTAVLVRVDGETTDRAVPRRDLRGLWLETLAATGRTLAGVKAHRALLSEIAGSGRDVTGEDLLRLAAGDEGLPDDTFTTLACTIEGE